MAIQYDITVLLAGPFIFSALEGNLLKNITVDDLALEATNEIKSIDFKSHLSDAQKSAEIQNVIVRAIRQYITNKPKGTSLDQFGPDIPDTAPSEILPSTEWHPTIGRPTAANSEEGAYTPTARVMAEIAAGNYTDLPPLGDSTHSRYTTLRTILDAAFNHAATGKGKERHARGLPFDDQPMMQTTRLVGPGFPLGQAIKKAQEASGMIDRGELDAAEAECLGAINYLAGAVAWMRERKAALPVAAPTSVGAAA